MPFEKERLQYPNGSYYIMMTIGKDIIGTAAEVPEGWLVPGRRKPVDSLEDAAKQCLDRRMNACMAEHERLLKLLGKVLS